jgi:hypothetical protein
VQAVIGSESQHQAVECPRSVTSGGVRDSWSESKRHMTDDGQKKHVSTINGKPGECERWSCRFRPRLDHLGNIIDHIDKLPSRRDYGVTIVEMAPPIRQPRGQMWRLKCLVSAPPRS